MWYSRRKRLPRSRQLLGGPGATTYRRLTRCRNIMLGGRVCLRHCSRLDSVAIARLQWIRSGSKHRIRSYSYVGRWAAHRCSFYWRLHLYQRGQRRDMNAACNDPIMVLRRFVERRQPPRCNCWCRRFRLHIHKCGFWRNVDPAGIISVLECRCFVE